MIQLSLLAVQVAPKLGARRFGAQKLMDFQCRALTELGNAYRVADQLDAAFSTFCHANTVYEQGTQDKSLLIRLLDFQASLAADQRHFGLACTVLSMLQKHHMTAGNDHQAGRALISRALYTGYSGRPEEAVGLLREALSLVDEAEDPDLAFAAAHNQVTFSVDCGRLDEAKKFLFLNRRRLEIVGGRVNRIKTSWEEGRIEAGCCRYSRAETILRKVQTDLSEVGLFFQASLVSLELAAVLMKLNRRQEAQPLVIEAARLFTGLGIAREALMAVLMLKRMFEAEQASAALVEEVATFVRRSQNDPNARFDPSPR